MWKSRSNTKKKMKENLLQLTMLSMLPMAQEETNEEIAVVLVVGLIFEELEGHVVHPSKTTVMGLRTLDVTSVTSLDIL